MLKTYFVLVVSVSLFAFYACRKDHSSNENSQRLKEEIYKEGDSIFYTFYFYDDQSRLIARKDSGYSGILRTSESFFEYDSKGRLSKISSTYSDPYYHPTIFSFEYNNDNQIIRQLELNSGGSIKRATNTYSYDARGRLIADSVYDYYKDTVNSYTVFTYDANDNVVAFENINKQNTAQNVKSVSISYGNNTNHYSSFGKLGYFIGVGLNEMFSLSKNNLTQIKYNNFNYYGGTTFDYKYEYSDNGLPKKIQVVTSYGQTEVYNDFVELYYE